MSQGSNQNQAIHNLVKSALRMSLGAKDGDACEIHVFNSFRDNVHLYIASPRYATMTDTERQDEIWSVLQTLIPHEALVRISRILTFDPNDPIYLEVLAERGVDPPKATSDKSVSLFLWPRYVSMLAETKSLRAEVQGLRTEVQTLRTEVGQIQQAKSEEKVTTTEVQFAVTARINNKGPALPIAYVNAKVTPEGNVASVEINDEHSRYGFDLLLLIGEAIATSAPQIRALHFAQIANDSTGATKGEGK